MSSRRRTVPESPRHCCRDTTLALASRVASSSRHVVLPSYHADTGQQCRLVVVVTAICGRRG